VELLDVSNLRINPMLASDVTSGIYMDVPVENAGTFEGFAADLCNFSENPVGSSSGSGSCPLSGLSFSWSISSGALVMNFSNSITATYRWLNDLDFENTFIIEAVLSTSTYSSINYWIPTTTISDSLIVSALANSFFESGEVATDPANLDSSGNINTDKTFGYYFDYSGTGTSGNAKNIAAFKDSNNNDVIGDSDRKWNVASSVVSINGISSFSGSGPARYIYDLCDETQNNAECFIWETREWNIVGIDGDTLWVIESERQNNSGPNYTGPASFNDSMERRFTFYERNTTIPGAPNSVMFNRRSGSYDIHEHTAYGH
jgi:hypothetical protein